MAPAGAAEGLGLQEKAFTELMDATEGYMQAQQALAICMKKGALLITQAQYAAPGPGRLGQDQYANHMHASTRVATQATQGEDVQFQEVERSSVSPAASGNQPGNPPSACGCTSEKEMALRWFGVLPHPSMRLAQQEYRNSVHLAVLLANARQRLMRASAAATDAGTGSEGAAEVSQ